MTRVSKGHLYEPLDWALLRTPLLPVAAYAGLAGASDAVWALAADPRVRAALMVGSDDLAAALARTTAGEKDSRRLHSSLLRYLIRMSTRPTPYGLFAGVGLVRFGAATEVALTNQEWTTQARPDMAWLLGLVMRLESRSDVRRRLRLFANPCAYELAGRVYLGHSEPGPTENAVQAVSVRATAPVRRVLSAARDPVGYPRLFQELLRLPGTTPDKAHTLLDELWARTLLLTDLRPPATITDPARYVLGRLESVPEASQEARGLQELLNLLRAWDELPMCRKADEYRRMVGAAERVHSGGAPAGQQASPRIQVDLAVPLRGEVGEAVAREARTAAQTLLRLTPWPSGPTRLQAYRHAFIDRYADAEVPLLELLDERVGLGSTLRYGHPPTGARPSWQRQRLLCDLAIQAVRDNRRNIVLDEETLAGLQTWTGPATAAPFSLDVSLFILATSPAAVDAGDFQVVVGPNVGASAAGRNTGRFASLLGPGATEALAEAARRESALRPEAVWAEVSYLPWRLRSANVAVRPMVRGAEIVVGTTGSTARRHRIRLDELLVGVRDNRFTLRSTVTGLEVVPCAGHMLNSGAAPDVCQLLDEIARDGRPHIAAFDWGPAAQFPFLPRVEYGRVVLAPAQWRVEPDRWPQAAPGRASHEFVAAVDLWRKQWSVPRHAYLSVADNRLLLDLEEPDHVALLRTAVHSAAGGSAVVLQEALPGPEHAWLPSPDGPRLAELVVPLVRRGGDPPSPKPTRPRQTVAVPDRLRPLGSDWLYVKLYGPNDLQDRLLTEHLLPFADFVLPAALATTWYFVRYADPQPHLRLRFGADPATILYRLLPEVTAWANELLADGEVTRWRIDNYEREVERYGGPEGITIAEAIAAHDSEAVARLLALDPAPVERGTLAVLAIDDLLTALGLDPHARRRWCGAVAGARHASGSDYRRLQPLLRQLMEDRTAALTALPNGAVAAQILEARRMALDHSGAQLLRLAEEDRLSRPVEVLLRSYVHLHCNRLLDTRADEEIAVGLLKRALDSLAARPPTQQRL